MSDEEFYRDHVIYSSYNYPDEDEVINLGIDFDLLLGWIDDEREALEAEFENSDNPFDDFGSFCLHKWITES